MKKILFMLFTGLSNIVFSQPSLDKLTVEKIMRDPKWIGTSPVNPYGVMMEVCSYSAGILIKLSQIRYTISPELI